METPLDIIGTNIRYYRAIAELTQEKLSERADLTRGYIGRLERGEVNVSILTLRSIADVLHVDAFVLLVPQDELKALMALAKHIGLADN